LTIILPTRLVENFLWAGKLRGMNINLSRIPRINFFSSLFKEVPCNVTPSTVVIAGFIPKYGHLKNYLSGWSSCTYKSGKVMTAAKPEETINTFYNSFGQKDNPLAGNGLRY